jgi:anti-sigma factor RsiW
MNNIYEKLVDMYADQELAEDLNAELEAVAATNPALKSDMTSLRATVSQLQNEDDGAYTEETHARILMKIYARAGEMQQGAPEPIYLQYQLPMSG